MADPNAFPTNMFPACPSGTGDAKYLPDEVSASYFPNPFLDYSSTKMPRSLTEVLWWAEYLWNNNGTYREASRRVSRHFLTSLEPEDCTDKDKEDYVEFLDNQLNIWTVLGSFGDDLQCYGNVFLSVYLPFRRYLACSNCGYMQPIEVAEYSFKEFKFKMVKKCPLCKLQAEYLRVDFPSQEEERIKLIRWNPREIEIIENQISGDKTYVWKIPAYIRTRIKRGDKILLETTPWEIVEAVSQDSHFEFESGQLFHASEENVSGILTGGWGLPRILANFKQAFYCQILKRSNEAIAFDYILPLRVISPHPGSSEKTDPLKSINLGSFVDQVQRMIASHRSDPASWHQMPFPMDAQIIGGEGKSLIPVDVLKWATEELLNDLGYPFELYTGSLQVQAVPTALRMFQMQWAHIPAAYEAFLNWAWEQISPAMGWNSVTWKLSPVTLADDLEKRGILLQLMGAQQVSPQTALGSLGIQPREELRRIYDWQRAQAEESRQFEEDQAKEQEMQELVSMVSPSPVQQLMSQGMGPGGMPPGGAPMGGAGGAPGMGMPMDPMAGGTTTPQGGTTPADMMNQAEQIAAQLLSMPYEVRRSQMKDLEKMNQPLYALVKDKMSEIRQQAKSQGGYQALKSMVGGGPGGGPAM